jgi:hypothetical protein
MINRYKYKMSLSDLRSALCNSHFTRIIWINIIALGGCGIPNSFRHLFCTSEIDSFGAVHVFYIRVHAVGDDKFDTLAADCRSMKNSSALLVLMVLLDAGVTPYLNIRSQIFVIKSSRELIGMFQEPRTLT